MAYACYHRFYLADSVDAYRICHNKALKLNGCQTSMSWEKIMSLMGMSSIEVAEHVCKDFSLNIESKMYQAVVQKFHPEVLAIAIAYALHITNF